VVVQTKAAVVADDLAVTVTVQLPLVVAAPAKVPSVLRMMPGGRPVAVYVWWAALPAGVEALEDARDLVQPRHVDRRVVVEDHDRVRVGRGQKPGSARL
jgi:hypothetical protein